MKQMKGFIAGFLCCALLSATLAFADDLFETISVKRGAMSIFVNGEAIEVDNILYNDLTYVPLRAYSEFLGKVVLYDEYTRDIRVDDRASINMINKEIAFLINGQPIRIDYFTQMMTWYKLNSGIKDLPDSEKEGFKQFVQQEIAGMIITEQYASDLGIHLSVDDQKKIDEKIAIYANNFGGLDEFKAMLKQEGILFEHYRSMQENYAIRSKLLDIITDEITDATLLEYYEQTKEIYRVEKVRAKHILFPTIDENEYPYPDSVKENIKFDASNVLRYILTERLDFDSAIATYSKDSGYKSNPDGYLFARGEMIKAFEDVAFATEPGQVYPELVESEIGYHIIQTVARVTVYTPFESVRDSIYNSLRNDIYYELMTPLVEDAEIIINTNVYYTI